MGCLEGDHAAGEDEQGADEGEPACAGAVDEIPKYGTEEEGRAGFAHEQDADPFLA